MEIKIKDQRSTLPKSAKYSSNQSKIIPLSPPLFLSLAKNILSVFIFGMQVLYYPNCNTYTQTKVTSSPVFTGGCDTMQRKLAVLVSETKKLYMSDKNINLADFETILRKISPTTSIKHVSQIPSGSNTSPRTGAYFSQKTSINPATNEMIVEDKVMYLNPNNSDEFPRQKLFGDFVHESTHIAQEEASDRLSSLDFSKRMLYSDKSPIEKQHSLVGAIQAFTSIEYNVLLPLINALRKSNDMPQKVPYADKNILSRVYQDLTGYRTTDYIKLVVQDIVRQIKAKLPFADEDYILKYVHKKAGHEKEAYQVSQNFLKDILKISGDTDLDYRTLLYDEFEGVLAQMIYR